MLATNLKDMNFEEILGIFKPFLYLVAPIFGITMIVIMYRLWKRTGNARLFAFMDATVHTEVQKRDYLSKYLTNAYVGSVSEGIRRKKRCCICQKKYSTEEITHNSRGDIIKRNVNIACPVCNFNISYSNEDDSFVLSRTPSDSSAEPKYKATFEKLSYLNDYYHPRMPETTDSDDSGDINITINIR